jgi:hypothetical protein
VLFWLFFESLKNGAWRKPKSPYLKFASFNLIIQKNESSGLLVRGGTLAQSCGNVRQKFDQKVGRQVADVSKESLVCNRNKIS